jgi:hypothetical protein
MKNRLKIERAILNTQEELAERIGVSSRLSILSRPIGFVPSTVLASKYQN